MHSIESAAENMSFKLCKQASVGLAVALKRTWHCHGCEFAFRPGLLPLGAKLCMQKVTSLSSGCVAGRQAGSCAHVS